MPEHMRDSTHSSKLPDKVHGLRPKRNAYTHPLLNLQKSVGNKALLHLRGSLGTLQTKLSLGQPNDLYEQEADTVASRIISQMSKMDQAVPGASSDASQPVHSVQRQQEEELAMPRRSETIQRQEDEEEYAQLRPSETIQRQPLEEEEELLQPRRSETIQRQEDEEEYAQLRPSETIQRQPLEEEEEMLQPRQSETIQRQEEEELAMPRSSEEDRSGSLVEGPVPDDLENQVERARQGGNALDTTVRSQMESGFGYDFNQVHIHTDSVSDNLSRQLSAEAFTLKNDIFFRNGRYNPSSTQGQDLLAHELTHVVQQGAAPGHNISESAESAGGV